MQFPNLFSPLRIGRVTVPNRISFSAHLTNLANEGLPTERLISYLAARARGGTGLIITEEQSVHPTDKAYEHLIEAFKPEVIPWYKRLTQAVHAYDTRVFAQLNHNGQQCSGSLSRLPVWAPSPIPDVLYREVPKAMEIEDIREVIEYFARSAVHVREGGFDGVELQFGHSSLARQFMSPLTNYRTDEYGGEFENRLRFAVELVAGVREALGADFTLGVRLCADELIPGGLTLEDAKQIAQRLQATGNLDYFNLTLATFYNLYLVGGPMHMPLGVCGAAGGGHQGSGHPAGVRHRAHQRPGSGRAGLGRRPGGHDRSGARPDLRPRLRHQGTRGAHRGDPLLHRLQPELLRPGGSEQDHRLRPEPVGGRRGHRRRASPAARRSARSGSWWWAEGRRACGRRRSPRCAGTRRLSTRRARSWAARCCWRPRAPVATSSA